MFIVLINDCWLLTGPGPAAEGEDVEVAQVQPQPG